MMMMMTNVQKCSKIKYLHKHKKHYQNVPNGNKNPKILQVLQKFTHFVTCDAPMTKLVGIDQ